MRAGGEMNSDGMWQDPSVESDQTTDPLAPIVALADAWETEGMDYPAGAIYDLRAALVEVRERLGKRLPDPKGGCICTAHSESRGGGYFETVVEYEPACPEHSEHVYDPQRGVWGADG